MPARVRKDDFVQIISGKDKGKTGKVLKIFPGKDACIVDRVSMVKRHQKAKTAGAPSGIIEKSMMIHLSKVMPVDSKTKLASRVRIKIKGDKRERVYVKSGESIDAEKV